MMPYGDELRRSRQMLHRFFQSSAIGDYAELQTKVTHKMLERLLKSPDEYHDIVRQYAFTSFTYSETYHADTL